jgi:Zn-finger nucleic acid-binding protein
MNADKAVRKNMNLNITPINVFYKCMQCNGVWLDSVKKQLLMAKMKYITGNNSKVLFTKGKKLANKIFK